MYVGLNVCRYLFLLGEEDLLEVLPQDTEQYTLHTVGEDLRFQTAEHETGDTGFGNDVLYTLRVGDLCGEGLLVDLDDPDAVGAGVANGRRGESHNGPSSKLGELVVLLGNRGAQVVIRKEPGVVAYEGRRCSGEGSVVERHGSVGFDLISDGGEFSGDLHRGL